MFPVVCATCGGVVGAKKLAYDAYIQNGVSPEKKALYDECILNGTLEAQQAARDERVRDALDILGITRYCCRVIFITTVDKTPEYLLLQKAYPDVDINN